MAAIDYSPLIRDMVWSYSRLEAFEACPYRWFLHYILNFESDEKFYASFGSFIHHLLEQFYSGKKDRSEIILEFITEFQSMVGGRRPNEKILSGYIQNGVDYLETFEPLPFSAVDIEKKIRFSIPRDGKPDIQMVGIIDYLGEKDGELYIVDHKSRRIRPRSGRAKPTMKDKELDDLLRQLYVYSIGVEQNYGRLPNWLCFNCFRTGTLIIEPFRQEAFEEAKRWVVDTVEKIESTSEFSPKQDMFSCSWICGVNRHCKYDIESSNERRNVRGL